jgi:nucleoside-diphosphate-sugar epimerase
MHTAGEIRSVEALEEILSRPDAQAVEALRRAPGDILLLGAGGKMGPTLARMARRAADLAGPARRVIAVSRFSDQEARRRLEGLGIETIESDLLARGALEGLPDAPNVLHLVGRKFGSTDDAAATWAANTFLPGLVAERFRRSRIVAFSTGNVYPLTPIASAGPSEEAPLAPAGDYAASCVGRERVLEYVSKREGTPVAIVRLNYAIDLRYGVLHDIGRKVLGREPVDLSMGRVNVIWQGDANCRTLALLPLAASPPFVLNLTGPAVSVRELAERLGAALGLEPVLTGREEPTALLSDPARSFERFGPPPTSLEEMVRWTADWVRAGGGSHGKPTHFETRDGKF